MGDSTHGRQANFSFWFSAEQWLALGTWALVAATTFLFFAAWRQIKEIREENRKAATLAVLGQYDLNANIYDALKTLWDARENGDLQKTPRKFRPQIVLLLNHLDAIAIGNRMGVARQFAAVSCLLAWHIYKHRSPITDMTRPEN